ncbi:hypothetical protein GMDG_06882 [Pseudogymnoascus destructans 20631-21]|uniref:CENP-V/GFA domain-containing protein n=1 Tax=Pseudogymnoascus destructans (strain ATCC MYA-4855 / 20631-21) TaxID=658429 RepID=L8FUI5_PSED2|nr:hypothetical protein GMDG_06882 [Pseudogymnoascus destructans 20631-21]
MRRCSDFTNVSCCLFRTEVLRAVSNITIKPIASLAQHSITISPKITMSEEEPKTNHGSCHCSNFAFTVNVPKINRGARCNCSLCHRKGYFWLSVTPEQFKADEGTGELACSNRISSVLRVELV